MKPAIALFALLVVQLSAVGAPVQCNSIASELNTMVQVDQALRERIDYENLPKAGLKESELPRLFQHIALVDRVHEARLARIISTCGWPKKSVHGEQATGDAWLLAQHASAKLQRRFLPLLQAAVNAGEVSGSNLAYLADRVALKEGSPQLYGTQFNQKAPCEFELYRIDDRRRVNERRKKAGMPSLEEYESQFREFLSTRGCPAR